MGMGAYLYLTCGAFLLIINIEVGAFFTTLKNCKWCISARQSAALLYLDSSENTLKKDRSVKSLVR